MRDITKEGSCLAVCIQIIVVYILRFFCVFALWNWILVPLLGIPTITIWQDIAITLSFRFGLIHRVTITTAGDN